MNFSRADKWVEFVSLRKQGGATDQAILLAGFESGSRFKRRSVGHSTAPFVFGKRTFRAQPAPQ